MCPFNEIFRLILKQKSEISVTIERTATDFKVSIKNFCNVIPADLCEDIFEKFKSRPIGKEKGGTGIGLYNVRNIIHLHQGNITCKSSAKYVAADRVVIPG